MRGRLVVAILVFGLSTALALPALGVSPINPNCWGVVSSQRAQQGGLGEHSSSFAGDPRLGLGNVARLILGEDAHVSDLGSVLAGLDGIEATSCP